MVKIEKLILHGFKSFRKKTELPFPEGFNVVAGPNGSGKSNIVDAMTFVLGTLSTKSLRADRLNELVYHGHKQKRPSKFAKVSLYLDNESGKIPTEDDTIKVTRKVNKKGNSVYKINGKIETRNKILDLLSSANVFPDGHNIIMQGDITRIIEMSPEQRREMIDEISGIADYDDKKVKAEKELEKVETRLSEFEIIVNEREEILNKLKKERDAAIKYEKLSKELKKLKASYLKSNIEKYENDFETLGKEIEEKTKSVEELQNTVDEAEDKMDNIEKRNRELSNKIFDSAKDTELMRKHEEVKNDIIRTQDKIKFSRKEIERIDQTIERLQELSHGGGKAVETILGLNRSGVYGTVSQLISFDAEHSTALEVCAGGHLSDIIVKDDRLAQECIKYLKREKIGRATFLPLNKIKERNPRDYDLRKKDGAIGWAIELIDFDKKYMSALKHVFGSTLVVEDIEAARRIGIGKTRMVTLSGDLIETSGAMIGGHYRKKKQMDTKSEVKKKKELENDINSLQNKLQELEKKEKELSDKLGNKSKDVLDLEKQRNTQDKEYEKLRTERKKNYERMLRERERLGKIKMERAKVEAKLDNFKAEFQDYKDQESFYRREIQELEKQVRETTEEINKLGPINQKAVEEYDIIRNEFTELSKKFYKLKEERMAVQEMIDEIETKRRNTFMKTFNEVRDEFGRIFGIATGGTGNLELEDSDDITSGLLIRANPEGKSLINMDSLSGGEKTMVALSFLFSLQKVRPAPFYILDEIDAALDKSNTEKIVKLVQELSKDAQYVVISHNDHTISNADRVVGVTMAGGESKILGVELAKSN